MGFLKINAKNFKMTPQEIVLGSLFIVYFVLGYPIPETIAEHLDTLIGKVTVFAVVFLLFVSSNPIVGVLGFL